MAQMDICSGLISLIEHRAFYLQNGTTHHDESLRVALRVKPFAYSKRIVQTKLKFCTRSSMEEMTGLAIRDNMKTSVFDIFSKIDGSSIVSVSIVRLLNIVITILRFTGFGDHFPV